MNNVRILCWMRIAILTYGCSGKSESVTPDNKTILTGQVWTLTDGSKNGVAVSLKACEKDNSLVFKTDGKWMESYNQLCGGETGDDNGTWNFSGSLLTITGFLTSDAFDVTGFPLPFDVVELNENTLRLMTTVNNQKIELLFAGKPVNPNEVGDRIDRIVGSYQDDMLVKDDNGSKTTDNVTVTVSKTAADEIRVTPSVGTSFTVKVQQSQTVGEIYLENIGDATTSSGQKRQVTLSFRLRLAKKELSYSLNANDSGNNFESF